MVMVETGYRGRVVAVEYPMSEYVVSHHGTAQLYGSNSSTLDVLSTFCYILYLPYQLSSATQLLTCLNSVESAYEFVY